jgi:hypothetical protein
VLTLGEGVGEGSFGQVFKAKLIVDPSTLISDPSPPPPPSSGSGGGGGEENNSNTLAFTSTYMKNQRESSSGFGGALGGWLMRAARGKSPTRESNSDLRGSMGSGGASSHGEYGDIAVKVMRATTKRHLDLIESEVWFHLNHI